MYPPPGSIMSYIGTSDPDGWLLCDGNPRTATDSRYSALYLLLGISTSTNDANHVTPPNLNDKFLYGRATTLTSPTTGGNSSVTLLTAHIPSHNHDITITDEGHTHVYKRADVRGDTDRFNKYTNSNDDARSIDNSNISTDKAYTGISASSSYVGGVTVGEGDSAVTTTSSFNILPPYYTVNYIIKY